MNSEIPRPATKDPSEPIRIEIPPPEVGIKQVDITGLGILTVRLAPIGSATSGYGDNTYKLSARGATSLQLTSWYTDGSISSSNATRAQLDEVVDNLNRGCEVNVVFVLEEVIAATGDIPKELDAVRLSGELTVDYLVGEASSGIGSVSIGYHIDVGRLQELRDQSSNATPATTPATATEHEAGA